MDKGRISWAKEEVKGGEGRVERWAEEEVKRGEWKGGMGRKVGRERRERARCLQNHPHQ